MRVSIWNDSLKSALSIFTNAEDLLLDSDLEFSIEVLKTTRGLKFMQSLHAIYTVIERINLSAVNRLEKLEGQGFTDLHLSISAKWIALQKIAKYCVVSKENEIDSIRNIFCAICLQYIAKSELIKFSECTYHSKCANFFVNHVRSQLPNLID